MIGIDERRHRYQGLVCRRISLGAVAMLAIVFKSCTRGRSPESRAIDFRAPGVVRLLRCPSRL